ncbi:MAG: DUF2318 domain-containing protein [Acidobacteria bacterium]|nr:DUF2318 domain-containing protein [Acidobacteriota bacterium]
MRKVKPLGALVAVILAVAALLAVNLLVGRVAGRQKYQQITPDSQGVVKIDVGDLEKLQVRFYRFINRGNQEVLFFVGRDENGTIQVAFDAGESHYRLRRGFSHQGAWIVDNKCESASHLSAVNSGGSGCKPTPLAHRVVGNQVVLQEGEILKGWRYFR